MLDPDIRVLSRGPGWLFAAHRDAYLLDWQTELSFEALDAALAGVRTLLQTQTAGIASISILHGAMKMASPELRAHTQRTMRETPMGVRCNATALVERGFWASAMRAAMSGMYLLENTPYPRRVFATLHDSIAWCSTMLGHDDAWTNAVAAAAEQVSAECTLSITPS